MSRVFYEVEIGSPAHAFCLQHAAERLAKKEEFADYAKSKGARGWVEGFTALTGLIFDTGVDIPAGLKKERKRLSDGSEWYSPRYSSTAGKVIAAEIEALGHLPRQSSFAKHFALPTGLKYEGGHCLHGAMSLTCGGAFENSLIAWPKEGEFWVVLPDIDGEIARLQAEGSTVEPSTWMLPPGLKRSSEARYKLAVAQAKVEDEEVSL